VAAKVKGGEQAPVSSSSGAGVGATSVVIQKEGLKESISRKLEIGDNVADIKLELMDDGPGEISYYDVSFKINGDYSSGAVGDKKEALQFGLGIRRNYKEIFEALPDGTLLSNQPYAGDDSGSSRQRLYERAGFGPVGGFGDSQWGVIKGGKVFPLDPDIAENLKPGQQIDGLEPQKT
jgi:hypothetical protein